MFVSDGEGKGCSFLGRVQERRLKFVPAPHALVYGTHRAIHDSEGGLWFAHDHTSRPQKTIHIAPQGQVNELKNVGVPLLIDETGNVWLGFIHAKPACVLNVYRDDRVSQTIELPGTDDIFGLFSDAPGSVYAWTAQGLQHLVATAPSFDNFQIEKLYALDQIGSYPQYLAYSRMGMIVALNRSGFDRRQGQLHLIQLPRLPK
jgi:hypothetical protein